MPDQNQHKIVLRLRLACDGAERFFQMRARGAGAGQGEDMNIAAGCLHDFVNVVRCGSEALVVIGFSAQSGYSHPVRAGSRRCGQRKQTCDERRQQGSPHTIPHRRRNNHSAERSSISTRNTSGKFHSSLVSRTVIPASEYGICSASFESSSGRQ